MAGPGRTRRLVGRLDQRLVELGLAPTRSRAQALIMAGAVAVNGQPVAKAGHAVADGDRIEVTEAALRYVSRGGLKLERAFQAFAVDAGGWTVVDVGASTGGFTDCWLQHGAARVYAVDVGHGQLAWPLRNDPRVVVLERTNARFLSLERLGRETAVDAGSVDVSFIGLRPILAAMVPMVRAGGRILALVKPQFEAGPRAVGKGGVVRDPAVHRAVLEKVVGEAHHLGLVVGGLCPSPVKGPSGNLEFLLDLHVGPGADVTVDIEATVRAAWQADKEGSGADG